MNAPSGNDLTYWGRQAMNAHQRAASDKMFDDLEPGSIEQRDCAVVTIADCLVALFKEGKSRWKLTDLADITAAAFLQAQKDIQFCRTSTAGWGGPIEYEEKDAEQLEQ